MPSSITAPTEPPSPVLFRHHLNLRLGFGDLLVFFPGYGQGIRGAHQCRRHRQRPARVHAIERGRIDKLEMVHQYVNAATSTNGSAYVFQDFDNLYTPDNFSAGTSAIISSPS